jgi:hypothetical protein
MIALVAKLMGVTLLSNDNSVLTTQQGVFDVQTFRCLLVSPSTKMRMFAYLLSKWNINIAGTQQTSQNIQRIRRDQRTSARHSELTRMASIQAFHVRSPPTAVLDKLQTIWGCPVHVLSQDFQEPQSPRHDAVPCTSSG